MSNIPLVTEESISKMIINIVSEAQDANRYFYNNLYRISPKIETDEKFQLDLIEFIMMWCDFGDLLTTKALINNFAFILTKTPSKSAMLSFLPLLREVITKCGNSILSELLIFSKQYKNICGEKFIQKKVFPFISSFIESEESDISSCSYSFLVNLIPEIGEVNIQKLISFSYKMVHFKSSNSRLAAINSFPILFKYLKEDPQNYFNEIVWHSIHDPCYLVQTHSIRVLSLYSSLIPDHKVLLDLSTKSSWKIKYSILEHIGVFIRVRQDFENVLFQFARNKDEMIQLRELAFHKIVEHFDIISNLNEVFNCVDVALRQKEENFVVPGLTLIPKIWAKDKELVQRLQSLFTRFRSTKKENIQFALIKFVLPCINCSQNEKDIAKKWILAAFESDDWRINDGVLTAVDFLINNKMDEFVSDDIFERVIKVFNKAPLNLRNRAAMVLVSFAKIRGWDFAKERILPAVRNLPFDQNLQATVRVYLGLDALGPPNDLKDEINSAINAAKGKSDSIYIIPLNQNMKK